MHSAFAAQRDAERITSKDTECLWQAMTSCSKKWMLWTSSAAWDISKH